ncbi:hypothetical protein NSK_008458, partial [Nannochloropsis salina CCMP1776]
MGLKPNDEVEIYNRENPKWWYGRKDDGLEGWFPASHGQLYLPLPSSSPPSSLATSLLPPAGTDGNAIRADTSLDGCKSSQEDCLRRDASHLCGKEVREGREDKEEEGKEEGREAGGKDREEEGKEEGREAGGKDREEEGKEEGREDKEEEGKEEGREAGGKDREEEGKEEGREAGGKDREEEGKEEGREDKE